MSRISERTAVLFVGPMRAGKTTAASYLLDKYGVERYSVAGTLKELYKETTNSFEKDREWLQKNGEAHRIVFGDDFWIQMMVDKLVRENPHSFSVDDIRYENELERAYDFALAHYSRVLVFYIKASLENQILRGAESTLMTHHSETLSRAMSNRIKITPEGLEVTSACGLTIPVLNGDLGLVDYLRMLSSEICIEESGFNLYKPQE